MAQPEHTADKQACYIEKDNKEIKVTCYVLISLLHYSVDRTVNAAL